MSNALKKLTMTIILIVIKLRVLTGQAIQKVINWPKFGFNFFKTTFRNKEAERLEQVLTIMRKFDVSGFEYAGMKVQFAPKLEDQPLPNFDANLMSDNKNLTPEEIKDKIKAEMKKDLDTLLAAAD